VRQGRGDEEASAVERAVHRRLTGDPTMAWGLQAGILDHEAAAERLGEELDLDAARSDVVTAIRTYEPEHPVDPEAARAVLSRASFSTRTGMARVCVPRASPHVQDVVEAAWETGDGLLASFAPGRRRVELLLEEGSAEEVVGSAEPEEAHVEAPLAVLAVAFPDDVSLEAWTVPLSLAVLQQEGIRVRTLTQTPRDFIVVVPEEEVEPAEEALRAFARAGEPGVEEEGSA
jgi:hypothetical protein